MKNEKHPKKTKERERTAGAGGGLLEKEVAAGARRHHREDGALLNEGLQGPEVLLVEGRGHCEEHDVTILHRRGIFGDQVRHGVHRLVGALKVAGHTLGFLDGLVPPFCLIGIERNGSDFVARCEKARDDLCGIAAAANQDGRHGVRKESESPSARHPLPEMSGPCNASELVKPGGRQSSP